MNANVFFHAYARWDYNDKQKIPTSWLMKKKTEKKEISALKSHDDVLFPLLYYTIST